MLSIITMDVVRYEHVLDFFVGETDSDEQSISDHDSESRCILEAAVTRILDRCTQRITLVAAPRNTSGLHLL